MSRSYQKTPIKGHTTCKSERLDKRLWHKRWRKHERIKLSVISPENLDDHCTTDRREVSNPWDMGKDGKHYYSPNNLLASIKEIAKRSYKNKKELIASERKIFYRWVGK